MQYRLGSSLGLIDARKCNADFGAHLPLVPASLSKGQVVELPETAAAYLSKKYKALLEPVEKVKGESKKPEITAPAK